MRLWETVSAVGIDSVFYAAWRQVDSLESAPQLIVAEFRCPSHVERLQAVQPAAVGTNK